MIEKIHSLEDFKRIADSDLDGLAEQAASTSLDLG